MKSIPVLIIAALLCSTFATHLAALEPAGTSGTPFTGVPPTHHGDPDIDAPDGIVNPNFDPECEFTPGQYECEDFSTSYCRQFPGGRANCRIIGFCGFPGDSGCHVGNVTRVRNPDGTYTYCVVEPQHNTALPGSCWIGDERWPSQIPGSVHEAICRYYEAEGLECIPTPAGPRLPRGPISPRIRAKVPWTWTSISLAQN